MKNRNYAVEMKVPLVHDSGLLRAAGGLGGPETAVRRVCVCVFQQSMDVLFRTSSTAS